MRGGLVTATRLIQVGHGVRVQNAEGIGTTWRDVDPARRGGRGSEEYMLFRYECGMCRLDLLKLLGHGCSPTLRQL